MKSISLLSLLACASAHAAVITGVTATASTYYAAQQTPDNLVNNSGLSVPDSFTATHSADVSAVGQWHAGAGQGIAGAAPVVDNQFVTFNLGGAYDLSAIYIWQMNQNNNTGRGVHQFDLLYSVDHGTNWLTASSNLNLTQSPGGTSVSAQQFSLVQSGVTNVRIEIDSAWSGAATDYVGLSEVKFDGVVTAVPEPSTYGLIGAGALAGFAFVRRRRRHAGKVA